MSVKEIYKKSLICLLLCWSPIALAQDSESILKNAAIQISEALSIIEVNAALRGSGTLVLLGDEPVVLTNSHVLQGRKTALLNYTRREIRILPQKESSILSFRDTGHVLFDSPSADIALLALPDSLTPDEKALTHRLAELNIQFCPIGAMGCHAGQDFRLPEAPISYADLQTGARGYAIEDWFGGRPMQMAVTLNSEPRLLEYKFDLWKAELVPDLSINGFYPRIYRLQFYAQPGISGGAFYNLGLYAGMLTQVSASAEASIYAIPREEIASVISGRLQLPSAVWENRDGRTTLESSLTSGGQGVLASSSLQTSGNTSAGGDMSNGGGDMSNGGDSSEGSLWEMRYWVGDGDSQTSMKVLSPFNRKKESFAINSRPVAFLEVRSSKNPDETVFMAPSLAAYNHTLLQSPASLAEIHYSDQEASEKLLMNSRLKAASLRNGSSDAIAYGRFGNRFTKMGFFDDPEVGPQSEGDPDICWAFINQSPPSDTACWGAENDLGTVWSPKLMANSTSSDLVDLKVFHNLSSIPDDTIRVTIPRDLSAVIIEEGATHQISRLLSVPHPENHRLIFEDGHGLRAAFIYNQSDLSEIERVIIDHPKTLIEIYLSPNAGRLL